MNQKKTIYDPFDTAFPAFFYRNMLSGSKGRSFKVDIEEDSESYMLYADLPGISKKNVAIRIVDNYLVIDAELKKETEEKENKRVIYREREKKHLSRSFRLHGDVDVQSVEASMAEGVLRLKLPKVAEATEKTVTIK